MKKSIVVLFVSTLLALAIACGGANKLGEGCEESGKTEGECETGGVCGKSATDALVCLKVCAVQTDCAADQDCNGVEGTNTKGCRSKSTTSPAPDGGKK